MQKIDKQKVFVAMSGGVDSSVAALLLKEKGYDVTGVFMRCYNLDGCSERDAEDARRVARHLKIPFYIWDFEEEYKKRVVDYMISGYKSGITPNPDVMCNKQIKFGLFLEKALSLDADCIATGHYVRLAAFSKLASQKKEGKLKAISYKLSSSLDKNKDQSYFLWTLTQNQLKYCLFPIGDYLKSDVRKIAKEVGLPTAEKKDSQGICFLGKISLSDFLKNYIPEKRGAVLTTAGEKIGEHKGAWFYTIGQRHIAIANRKGQIANSKPIYVADKNIKSNTVVIAQDAKNPELYKEEIKLKNVNFIDQKYSNILENVGISVWVRVRYRQPLFSAKLFKLKANSYELIPDKPVKFVAPGQSAVFYNKRDELLGGGIIL